MHVGELNRRSMIWGQLGKVVFAWRAFDVFVLVHQTGPLVSVILIAVVVVLGADDGLVDDLQVELRNKALQFSSSLSMRVA